MARELGFSDVGALRSTLTYGQFHACLDDADERLFDEWVQSVEAARIGYVTAQDSKAHDRWSRSVKRAAGRQVGLSGEALEQTVANFAAVYPQFVEFA